MSKQVDAEGLSQCDGKEGRPAYVAYKGRIIDVSGSRLWRDGLHMGRHTAGKDLTGEIEAAPHGIDVLDRYPEVGTLVEEAKPHGPAMSPLLSGIFARYPLLRRHPHPAVVHFPIVFTLSASFFSILYVLTGNRSFDHTAFYCLAGALLFTPLGILTGFLTWWVNYLAMPMRAVTIKKNLSFVMLAMLLILLVWHGFDPTILDRLSGPAILYLALVTALSPLVLIVAYYGGTLTFPLEKH